MKYVLGAKCVRCGKEYEAVPGLTTCACGGILDIVYDYAAIRRDFSPKDLAACRWRIPLPRRLCGWAGRRCTRRTTWPGRWG